MCKVFHRMPLIKDIQIPSQFQPSRNFRFVTKVENCFLIKCVIWKTEVEVESSFPDVRLFTLTKKKQGENDEFRYWFCVSSRLGCSLLRYIKWYISWSCVSICKYCYGIFIEPRKKRFNIHNWIWKRKRRKAWTQVFISYFSFDLMFDVPNDRP